MEKFEKIKELGNGTYGVVYKCRNSETGQIVAIKIFRETEEDSLIKKTASREIKMLKMLKHPNLINLIEVFRRKKRLNLVFEYCEFTLLNEIQDYPRGYPQDKTKRVIWQLLEALKFCHSKNVIHRDIKPENILLTKEGVVKLCDFGFARTIDKDAYLTDYVATRWYRAPELLVGDIHYGSAVDVWAVGCVFAELSTGDALWMGKSDLDQLHQIRKNIGDLLPKHLDIFHKNEWYQGATLKEPSSTEPLKKKLSVNFPKYGIEFLENCVDKDPSQRWTCEQLQSHPYFKGFSYELPQHELDRFESIRISTKSPNLLNSISLPQLATPTNFPRGSFSTSSSPEPTRNHFFPDI